MSHLATRNFGRIYARGSLSRQSSFTANLARRLSRNISIFHTGVPDEPHSSTLQEALRETPLRTPLLQRFSFNSSGGLIFFPEAPPPPPPFTVELVPSPTPNEAPRVVTTVVAGAPLFTEEFAFISRLDTEVNKVSTFFAMKEDKLRRQLDSILRQLAGLARLHSHVRPLPPLLQVALTSHSLDIDHSEINLTRLCSTGRSSPTVPSAPTADEEPTTSIMRKRRFRNGGWNSAAPSPRSTAAHVPHALSFENLVQALRGVRVAVPEGPNPSPRPAL